MSFYYLPLSFQHVCKAARGGGNQRCHTSARRGERRGSATRRQDRAGSGTSAHRSAPAGRAEPPRGDRPLGVVFPQPSAFSSKTRARRPPTRTPVVTANETALLGRHAEHVPCAHSVALNSAEGDGERARGRRPRRSERRCLSLPLEMTSFLMGHLGAPGTPHKARGEGRGSWRERDHRAETGPGLPRRDPQTSSPARGAPRSVPRARGRLRRARPLPASRLVLGAPFTCPAGRALVNQVCCVNFCSLLRLHSLFNS